MTFADWRDIITVFLLSTFKLSFIGVGTSMALGFSFLKSFIVCSAGGITGSFVLTYAIEFLSEKYLILKKKFFPNSKPDKIFTWKNRLILKVRKKFGLIGISIISPILISYPLGIFLSIRFLYDRKMIVTYMSIATIAGFFISYLYLHFFREIYRFIHSVI